MSISNLSNVKNTNIVNYIFDNYIIINKGGKIEYLINEYFKKYKKSAMIIKWNEDKEKDMINKEMKNIIGKQTPRFFKIIIKDEDDKIINYMIIKNEKRSKNVINYIINNIRFDKNPEQFSYIFHYAFSIISNVNDYRIKNPNYVCLLLDKLNYVLCPDIFFDKDVNKPDFVLMLVENSQKKHYMTTKKIDCETTIKQNKYMFEDELKKIEKTEILDIVSKNRGNILIEKGQMMITEEQEEEFVFYINNYQLSMAIYAVLSLLVNRYGPQKYSPECGSCLYQQKNTKIRNRWNKINTLYDKIISIISGQSEILDDHLGNSSCFYCCVVVTISCAVMNFLWVYEENKKRLRSMHEMSKADFYQSILEILKTYRNDRFSCYKQLWMDFYVETGMENEKITDLIVSYLLLFENTEHNIESQRKEEWFYDSYTNYKCDVSTRKDDDSYYELVFNSHPYLIYDYSLETTCIILNQLMHVTGEEKRVKINNNKTGLFVPIEIMNDIQTCFSNSLNIHTNDFTIMTKNHDIYNKEYYDFFDFRFNEYSCGFYDKNDYGQLYNISNRTNNGPKEIINVDEMFMSRNLSLSYKKRSSLRLQIMQNELPILYKPVKIKYIHLFPTYVNFWLYGNHYNIYNSLLWLRSNIFYKNALGYTTSLSKFRNEEGTFEHLDIYRLFPFLLNKIERHNMSKYGGHVDVIDMILEPFSDIDNQYSYEELKETFVNNKLYQRNFIKENYSVIYFKDNSANIIRSIWTFINSNSNFFLVKKEIIDKTIEIVEQKELSHDYDLLVNVCKLVNDKKKYFKIQETDEYYIIPNFIAVDQNKKSKSKSEKLITNLYKKYKEEQDIFMPLNFEFYLLSLEENVSEEYCDLIFTHVISKKGKYKKKKNKYIYIPTYIEMNEKKEESYKHLNESKNVYERYIEQLKNEKNDTRQLIKAHESIMKYVKHFDMDEVFETLENALMTIEVVNKFTNHFSSYECIDDIRDVFSKSPVEEEILNELPMIDYYMLNRIEENKNITKKTITKDIVKSIGKIEGSNVLMRYEKDYLLSNYIENKTIINDFEHETYKYIDLFPVWSSMIKDTHIDTSKKSNEFINIGNNKEIPFLRSDPQILSCILNNPVNKICFNQNNKGIMYDEIKNKIRSPSIEIEIECKSNNSDDNIDFNSFHYNVQDQINLFYDFLKTYSDDKFNYVSLKNNNDESNIKSSSFSMGMMNDRKIRHNKKINKISNSSSEIELQKKFKKMYRMK